jgi:hypothetical protein
LAREADVMFDQVSDFGGKDAHAIELGSGNAQGLLDNVARGPTQPPGVMPPISWCVAPV